MARANVGTIGATVVCVVSAAGGMWKKYNWKKKKYYMYCYVNYNMVGHTFSLLGIHYHCWNTFYCLAYIFIVGHTFVLFGIQVHCWTYIFIVQQGIQVYFFAYIFALFGIQFHFLHIFSMFGIHVIDWHTIPLFIIHFHKCKLSHHKI